MARFIALFRMYSCGGRYQMKATIVNFTCTSLHLQLRAYDCLP